MIEDAKFSNSVLKAGYSTEEGIAGEKDNQDEVKISTYRITVTIDNKTASLIKLIEILQEHSAVIEHIESRHNFKHKEQFEIYLEIKCSRIEYSNILNSFRNAPKCFLGVNLIKTEIEKIWIPLSVWDLDYCNHLKINYEPEIDSKHPGFSDMEYRKRRQEIANFAFKYKQ